MGTVNDDLQDRVLNVLRCTIEMQIGKYELNFTSIKMSINL